MQRTGLDVPGDLQLRRWLRGIGRLRIYVGRRSVGIRRGPLISGRLQLRGRKVEIRRRRRLSRGQVRIRGGRRVRRLVGGLRRRLGVRAPTRLCALGCRRWFDRGVRLMGRHGLGIVLGLRTGGRRLWWRRLGRRGAAAILAGAVGAPGAPTFALFASARAFLGGTFARWP
jgi:hypothetical protein